MSTKEPRSDQPIFCHENIWILIGVVSFLLPISLIVVQVITNEWFESISAAYCAQKLGMIARNFLVGFLFTIAALLFIYTGLDKKRKWAPKVGAICAIVVALWPGCKDDWTSLPHSFAAIYIFLMMALFSYNDFANNTSGDPKGVYRLIFKALGIVMVLVLCVIAGFVIDKADKGGTYSIIFWLESLILWLFGAAWWLAAFHTTPNTTQSLS